MLAKRLREIERLIQKLAADPGIKANGKRHIRRELFELVNMRELSLRKKKS